MSAVVIPADIPGFLDGSRLPLYNDARPTDRWITAIAQIMGKAIPVAVQGEMYTSFVDAGVVMLDLMDIQVLDRATRWLADEVGLRRDPWDLPTWAQTETGWALSSRRGQVVDVVDIEAGVSSDPFLDGPHVLRVGGITDCVPKNGKHLMEVAAQAMGLSVMAVAMHRHPGHGSIEEWEQAQVWLRTIARLG